MGFRLFAASISIAGVGLLACAGGPTPGAAGRAAADPGTRPAVARGTTSPPRVAIPDELAAQNGREIRLVGRYGRLKLDVRFGDPARDPGYVVLWVRDRPVRLGLTPRPAEERDRLLDETVEVRGTFQLAPPAPPPSVEGVPELAHLPVLIPGLEPVVPLPADRLSELPGLAPAAPAPPSD